MSYLKGNYDVGKKVEPEKPASEDEKVKAFERFARARLGGSIAFVMKGKTFVWSGDQPPRRPAAEK